MELYKAINITTTVLMCVLLSATLSTLVILWKTETRPAEDLHCEMYNTISCANGGLLIETENGFACKCAPNYYGETCSKATFWLNILWLIDQFRLKSRDEHRGMPKSWWMNIPLISHFGPIRVYEFHQNQVKRLKMFPDTHDHGESVVPGTRILPPARPSRCLPDKRLPSLNLLSRELLQRESDELKSDPNSKNILYHAFYQHFMLQFFGCDFNLTVTASQVYGADEITGVKLRTFSDGKLKTEILDSDSGSSFMSFFKGIVPIFQSNDDFGKTYSHWFNRIMSQAKFSNLKFPLGDHRWSKTSAVHSTMSLLWVSEHNRVCDLLMKKWPSWTDGEIYNTARRIVIGEMMTIMMNDIMDVHVAHSYPTKLKPDMFRFIDRHESVGISNTPFELFLTTMWPTDFRQEQLSIMLANGGSYARNENTFSSDNVLEFMVKNKMIMVTHNNENAVTKPLAEFLLKLSRENSMQSFNNYRRQLNLYAYASFFELTGNLVTAEKLQMLYGDIENVELLSGILTEKLTNGISQTLSVMTNSFVINSILTNPLTNSWNPDTFGELEGFDIVKNANIETFVCNNLPGKCENFKVKLYSD